MVKEDFINERKFLLRKKIGELQLSNENYPLLKVATAELIKIYEKEMGVQL